MNCQKCGANIEGKQFCPYCGTPAGQTPASPASVQPRQGNPTKVLVFGILGLALSGGFIGLVFSIIGLVMAKRYRAQYGAVSKQVNIGRGLSIAGIIVSIMILAMIISLIIIVAANWTEIEAFLRENAGKSYDIRIQV